MNNTLKSLMVAGAVLAVAVPAMASTEVSNKAMMEVRAARDDLKANHPQAAIERLERAETALLNAKQAGDETAPSALDAMQNAHKDIMDHNKSGAMGDLDSAISALRS